MREKSRSSSKPGKRKKKGRLKAVKQEIRVIGIGSFPSGSGTFLIGVIFRGKSLLDGVIKSMVPKDKPLAQGIADMILGSTHFEQLRAVLMDEATIRSDDVDIKVLHKLTKLPVIVVSKKPVKQTIVSRPIGLSRQIATQVLQSTCVEDIPEALRVARILSEELKSQSLKEGVL